MPTTNKRSARSREALLVAREEAALKEIANLGGLVTLYEPRQDDTAGTCVVRLTSTEGKVKLLSGVSASHALDALHLHEAEQSRLSPDSPRVWKIAKEPVAVPVIARRGSENLSRERRVASAQHVAAHHPVGGYTAVGAPPERII